MRAYTQATQAAIEAAQVVTISRCVDVLAEVPYSLYESTVRVAEATGAKVVESDFGAAVALTLRMLDGTQDELVRALTEATSGVAEIMAGDPFDAAF